MERHSESGFPGSRGVPVHELLIHDDVRAIITLCAGEEGQHRLLTHPRIQKSGLVLVGHTLGIVPTRVQVLGETEISYLESLQPQVRAERVRGLFDLSLSLVIVTRGVEPPPELLDEARRTGTPLCRSAPRSSRTINVVHSVLDQLLAPTDTVHGVLVDVHGVGTLLLGPSGIGKSECALFLLERGDHRLVADDQVILTRLPSGRIVGRPPALLRHHLEVRGIGIINIRDLFGAAAVRDQAEIDLVVELLPWDDDADVERLGLDEQTHTVLGAAVPFLRIPVRPGRNMAVILEVAARNQLLKAAGHHAARKLVRTVAKGLGIGDPMDGDGGG